MVDKVEKIKEYCKQKREELMGYVVSDDYDDIEKHDCIIAMNELEYLEDFIDQLN